MHIPAIPLVMMATGLAVAVWAHLHRSATAAVSVLLVTPYLASSALCLYAFHDYRQIGYWLTAFAVIVALMDVFTALCRKQA
jgi:hypothetical protein